MPENGSRLIYLHGFPKEKLNVKSLYKPFRDAFGCRFEYLGWYPEDPDAAHRKMRNYAHARLSSAASADLAVKQGWSNKNKVNDQDDAVLKKVKEIFDIINAQILQKHDIKQIFDLSSDTAASATEVYALLVREKTQEEIASILQKATTSAMTLALYNQAAF